MRTLTDIVLEQERLEKSFKYIRKFWKNGRWNYVYEEPNLNRVKEGNFGKFLTDFVGKPRAAFRHLFREKTGQARDVATIDLPVIEYDEQTRSYVERKGSVASTGIDLVWGTNGRGLKHILRRHFMFMNDFSSIQDCEVRIANLLKGLEKGLIKLTDVEVAPIKEKDGKEQESDTDIHRVKKIVAKTSTGEKLVIDVEVQMVGSNRVYRHFILTDYDVTQGKEDKENSELIQNQRRRQLNKRSY